MGGLEGLPAAPDVRLRGVLRHRVETLIACAQLGLVGEISRDQLDLRTLEVLKHTPVSDEHPHGLSITHRAHQVNHADKTGGSGDANHASISWSACRAHHA